MAVEMNIFWSDWGVLYGNNNADNWYDVFNGLVMNDGFICANFQDFLAWNSITWDIDYNRYTFFEEFNNIDENIIDEYTFYQNTDDNRIYDFYTFWKYSPEYLTPYPPFTDNVYWGEDDLGACSNDMLNLIRECVGDNRTFCNSTILYSEDRAMADIGTGHIWISYNGQLRYARHTSGDYFITFDDVCEPCHTISVYSQKIRWRELANPMNSIIYNCDGLFSDVCYGKNCGNMEEFITMLNDENNCFIYWGTYYDNGDLTVRLEITPEKYNDLCLTEGGLTMQAIYD